MDGDTATILDRGAREDAIGRALRESASMLRSVLDDLRAAPGTGRWIGDVPPLDVSVLVAGTRIGELGAWTQDVARALEPAGDDELSLPADLTVPVTVVAGGGDDVVGGSAWLELVSPSGAGDDRLFGGGGRDVLLAGAGDDELWGGDGDDVLDGQAGDDRIDGGDGTDSAWGGRGDDEVRGGRGQDVLAGGSGVDLVDGGLGADVLEALAPP